MFGWLSRFRLLADAKRAEQRQTPKEKFERTIPGKAPDPTQRGAQSSELRFLESAFFPLIRARLKPSAKTKKEKKSSRPKKTVDKLESRN